MSLWGLIAVLIIALDQITKYLVINNIGPNDTVTVIKNVFEFVYVKNTGGAFSILNNATWLLSIVSIIFCIGVVVYFIKVKPKEKNICLALSMMFAGALGNAIDRIFRGFVVDFIKTSFINFPVFNVADILVAKMVFFDNTKNLK